MQAAEPCRFCESALALTVLPRRAPRRAQGAVTVLLSSVTAVCANNRPLTEAPAPR